jgi:hypothetical protein
VAVVIERVAWGGWPNCRRISNGEVELIVTGDIGPRIMRYGFVGGQNFFKVFEDQAGKSGEPEWQFRGGHRVWLAPEHIERTYAPDNSPVEIEVADGVLTATQQVEPSTGLQKQLMIRLADRGTHVEVVHRMKNTLPSAVEVSVWALTMMASGGTAVTGFPPRSSHADALAPTNPLVMWAFTDLSDKRWTFLEKYLVLRHDPAISAHTKLGHFNKDTWAAYFLGSETFRNSEMFLKWCATDPARLYPDFGCSCELFASDAMLEIETLGPLTLLEPSAWIDHVEHWSLHRDVVVSAWSGQALDGTLSTLLAARDVVDIG